MTNDNQQPNNPYAGQTMSGQSMSGQPLPGQPLPNQQMQPYYQQEGPQDSTVMILAIIGIFFPPCAWIGWYMGSKAKKDAVAMGTQPTQKLNTWTLVAMIFSILSFIGIVLTIIYAVFGIIMFAGIASSGELASMAPLVAMAA